MPYWTLLHGTKSANVPEEPEKRSDGTVVSKGQIWPKGTKVVPHDGDIPELPRASIPPKTGRPKRKNPAQGFGRDNIT
jgi:hypothetical protein